MKRILNILFLMVMAFSLSAQTTLTFEGKDRTGQDYVRLSRVSIDNDDQLWHQNIYYPDTVLVLYANGTVGIETFHETFLQMQNSPNPFDGTTDVVLSTPYDGDVTMEITDVNGHIVGTHCVCPQSGTHQFRISLSTPGTYVLTARQTGHTVSVKMVNMGNGGGNGIEYMGTVETGRAPSLQLTPKSGTRGDGHYPFRSWDRMRYTGYAMVDDTEIASETVEKRQIASEVIPLRFDIARPEVETHAASNIAATSVVLNGEVLTDNNANVTERGFIYIKNSGLWNFGTDVAAGNGSGTYSTQLTGLFPATTYHVKAYATNAVGTTYGQVETFRTMDTLPVVTTTEPSNISATTFTSGGEVLALNSTGLTARGICWNTTGAPTVADNHTTQSGGLGSFTANVTGLSCGTTYYVRAYATNSVGTAYGEEYTAITTQELAMVNTAVISDIMDNSAVCGGTVTYDGCSEVTVRGVCWSTSHNPTIADNHTTDGSGLGDFTSNMTGANYATTYYVRAYATNGVGTTYGEELSFTTQPILPTVTTVTSTDVTATTFTCGGDVTNDGGAEVTVRGICWSTNQNPTIADNYTTDGSGLGTFTSNVTGLSCGTTYYVRAYATNSVGTAYGEEYSVTTTQELAQVVTGNVSSITDNTAVCSGEVTYDGCSEVTARGVCWNTTGAPTLADSYTAEGSGLGDFTSQLTGLNYATTYYVRAYATNGVGTTYGEELSFTTQPILPSVTTATATDITATTFTCGGDVTNNGGAEVTARGICWSTEQNPTIADSYTTDGSGLGTFASNVTGLFCGTTYYVRAYATNSVGTAYGEEYSVTTLPQSIPEVRLAMVNIYNGLNILTQAGVITENCSAVTERGVCWSTSHNSTLEDSHTVNGEGIGVFNDTLTNLEIATNYYIRAYATNELGTAYSEEESITTPDYPTVTTTSITDITSSTATSGGNIINDGGALLTARGVCWSTEQNPTIADSHTTDGTGTGSFTSSVTGLTAVTTYYVRAYATNNVGTSYGDELTFTTLETPCGEFTLTDIDGNTYNTVQIGSQCWMKENLRTTKYADGTSISQGSSTSTTTGYWYYPDNDASNKTTYGLLYNWKAVMRNSSSSSANPSGVQGVCPTGWHVPSDAEWTQLTNYVSSQSEYVCGSDNTYIAKALAGTTGWSSGTTTCAVGNMPSQNNSTGFSALPAGYYNGSYYNFGLYACFWSATEGDSSGAWTPYLLYNGAGVYRGYNFKTVGYSVRCLRDEGGSTTSQFPTITTSSVTDITSTTATSGGSITSDGGATVTARGVCWNTTGTPSVADSHTIDGHGTGSFTSSLAGLTAATTYYVRAYATNSVGTAYGNEVSFTTEESATGQDGQPCPDAATLTDRDGNTYNTVLIGTQCWMKENLRTTKYADGTSISQGSSISTTTAYWYYPNNDASNKTTYGLLYNWKAVMRNSSSSDANPSGVQGICPTGWHVPSDAEWKQMEMAVGMSQSDADNTGYRGTIAAKLSGNTGWTCSSTTNAAGNLSASGRNSSGFSALPAGYYLDSYYSFGDLAYFWSATELGSSEAWRRNLYYGNAGVNRGYNSKKYGYSVRCVKD